MQKAAIQFVESPSERWTRVVQLVRERRKPSRQNDDKWIHRAWKYWKAWVRNTGGAREELERKYHDIHKARVFYEVRSVDRYAYEAAVLADVKPEDVYVRMGQSPEMLEAFEALFYNVRPMLESDIWIRSNLMAPAMRAMGAPHPQDYDCLWKMLAYDGNWDIVEVLWRSGGLISEKLEERLSRLMSGCLLRKGFMAASSLEINRFNAVEITKAALEAHAKQVEIGSSGANIDVSVRQVVIAVGKAIKVSHPDDHFEADEKRADELVNEARLALPSPVKEN